MFIRKTDYMIDKAAWEAKHSECELHRRKTDEHLLAIRTMLETWLPSIKYVDSRRNFTDTAKDIAIWIAAISAGFAGIIYILKTIGV